MIDFEYRVFSEIKTLLEDKFPGIYVTSTYREHPPKFPTVFLQQEDEVIADRHQSSSLTPEFTDVSWRAEVYSNLIDGAAHQCKEIMWALSDAMLKKGFTQTINSPLANLADTTIHRRVARWRGTYGTDCIYRR